MKKVLSLLLSTALVVGSVMISNTVSAKDTLQLKGSDTMVHLATNWAEDYMKKNEGSEIAVTGGGSGTGIAALLNGTADIACASRKIKQKEIDRAKAKGVTIIEHVVARDGIGVIVNPKNPVNDVTMKQLKKMYIGEYKKWKKVGGPNKKILLLSRDSSSGTYAFFQKKVLEKMDYSVRARRMPSNAAIVQTVAEDKWSVGYVGLGYVVKAGSKIKALKVEGIAPSQATVVDNSYVINRPLHLYTNGEPTGNAKAFLDYVMGKDGQGVVNEMGFVAVK